MKRNRAELFEQLKLRNPNFKREVATVKNRLGKLVKVVRYTEYPTDQFGNELSLATIERIIDGERVVRNCTSGEVVIRFETATERVARLKLIASNQKAKRRRNRAAWEARKGRRRRWSAACDRGLAWNPS